MPKPPMPPDLKHDFLRRRQWRHVSNHWCAMCEDVGRNRGEYQVRKIAKLKSLQAELQRMLQQCRGGR
jgi:predicted transposase YbfD/YdcC